MSTSALAESNPDVSNMSRMVLAQVHFAGYGSYDEFIGVVLPTMPQPSVRFAIRKMAMSFETGNASHPNVLSKSPFG
jgi:hypothetical protein